MLENFKQEEKPDILQNDRNHRFKDLTYNNVANRSALRNIRVDHFGSNEEDRIKSGESDLVIYRLFCMIGIPLIADLISILKRE